ncbi:MAG: hypothetical protein HFE64_04815 [Lachnospiraceae bacterium]|nr:hypothetical protein [Lachnospiraceae bacterium]
MTGNTYPGFRGMIHELEDVFILWWMDGSPKINYKVHYRADAFDTSLSASSFPYISLSCTYDVQHSGFLLLNKTTVEEDQLKAYCQKNGFTYQIRYWSKYVSVYISIPDYETLKKSALMTRVHEMHTWFNSFIPLAKKFYALPLMNEIEKHEKFPSCINPAICRWGISYEKDSDSEGYTNGGGPSFLFKNYGYRDLQSSDEMVAFMLAYCARRYWKISPDLFHFYGIRWHYYRNPDPEQKISVLPRYYAYDPLTYVPASNEPPLKDFFA